MARMEGKQAIFTKRKNIFLIVLAVFVLIRIGYITIRGELDKDYYRSYSYSLSDAVPVPCTNILQRFSTEQNRLESLELMFTDIGDDKNGTVTVCIYAEDELLYQTDISLEKINNDEWKTVFINAPMSPDIIYSLSLNANSDCTQIPNMLFTKNRCAPEIIDTSIDNQVQEGNIAVVFGYLQFPGRADRIVAISFWLILYAIIFLVINNIEKLNETLQKTRKTLTTKIDERVLSCFVEMMLCLVIINCSGIEFQEMTKIIFFVISFFSVTNYPNKKAFILGKVKKEWQKVLISLLPLYASFALVGQRILIYPLNIKLTIHGLFILSCCALWFVPVMIGFFFNLEKLSNIAFDSNKRIKTWKLLLLLIVILLLPAAYNLFANNPGISSYDTRATMITNAKNLHRMYDWHPAFYCMALRVIETVWDSTYAVIIVQYFFWTYVLVEFFMYLRKKGVKDAVIILGAAFCGLNAANFIHINTIWKDIPYTLSLLWVFVILAKLSVDFAEYRKKWFIYFELIVALIGTYFYRKNGIVPFVIVVVALIIIFLQNNKKILITVLLTVMAVGIIRGPVYSYFQVVNPGIEGIYQGLGQDILGAYYYGGEVSESTLQMINQMTSYNIAEYNYNPTWSRQSYEVDVVPKQFIRNYLDTFLKNPILMIRGVIAREDAMWDVYAGKDTILGCVNYTRTQDGIGEWNEYYSRRIFRSLSPVMSAATEYTAETQWISAIEWRSGLFCLLGLMCAIWLAIRCGKGKYLIVLAPIAGQILGLLLSTGWSDFRYYWPLNLMNFFLILLSLVVIHHREEQHRVSK